MRISLLLPSLILILTCNLNAQEGTPYQQKEIYISMAPISPRNYGVQFKAQMKENTFFRIALTSIHLEYADYSPAATNSFPRSDFIFHSGIEVGFEKRKGLGQRVHLFYGGDFILNTAYNHHNQNNPNLPIELRDLNDVHISSGIGFKSGLLVNIKSGFLVSAELSPQVLCFRNSSTEIIDSELGKSVAQGFAFNMAVESMKISLIYRWGSNAD